MMRHDASEDVGDELRAGKRDGVEAELADLTDVAPPTEGTRTPRDPVRTDGRTVVISLLAAGVAVAAAVTARLLAGLIGLATNIAYYGRFSTRFVSPAGHHLGNWAILPPVVGGLLVGAMARYGSRAIRGHGIPEAMEQVLTNESRIPPRLTFLKPLSAAVAIGTGGPFGAEGPIIATGGALGSFVGQALHTTAVERKTLLAAGAAAGMTATFGCPVAAVLLAVELLLFEFRLRSLLPVALACAVAAGVRDLAVGSGAVFPMVGIGPATGAALIFYLVLGAVVGLAAVGVTRLVYSVEDAFERLPISWVWWPALGGLAVGIVGRFAPHTLGVGYDNIERIVAGTLTGRVVLLLCLAKLLSWSIALGSGTSGGTLAPLLTIGGGLGAVLGGAIASAVPSLGIDPRVAALVGMAAIFAGSSRALLASVVFAFEATQQPASLLPLLAGGAAACLVSALLMKNTIMTEKIARRGIRVPSDYGADHLDLVSVRAAATAEVVTLRAEQDLAEVRRWLGSPGVPRHQGLPVLDGVGRLIGVLTRRDLLGVDISPQTRMGDLVARPPVVIYPENSLREAADHMVHEGVGRLAVVERDDPSRLVGILTRGDVLAAHGQRLRETHETGRTIRLRPVSTAVSGPAE